MASFSIRAKWSTALLLVATVPLAILAVLSVRVQRQGLERAEEELQLAAIDQVAAALSRELDPVAEATHRVGLLLTDGRIADDDARLALATDAVARVSGIDFVAIYDPGGAYVDAIVSGEAGRAVHPPEHLVLPNAGPSAGGAWLPVDRTSDALEVRYLEPMLAGTELRGWVLGRLVPERLARMAEDISHDRFNAAGRVSIVDDHFQAIAGGGGPGAQSDPRSMMTAIHAPPTAFEADLVGTTEFTDASGVRMVGSLRTLPPHRWAIVVRRPEAEAYGALEHARTVFMTTALLSAALAIVVGIWLAGRSTSPIRSLIELTRAYGRRDFAARSKVHTGDELEELGNALSSMAHSIAEGDKEIARRRVVEASLSRYLPSEIAKAVAEGEKSLALGGERRMVSVIFADVVAFTSFAEGSPPERVVAFLNELFTVLSEVVFRHRGMVDKFIGDCVMAVFGATGDDASDHARRAVDAARDMHRFVEAAAPGWKETYGFDVSLGIGITTGEAIVGNLGSEVRMEFTAIGDMVNAAARLEMLAQSGQTLVSGEVVAAIGDRGGFRSLGEQPLRGKKKAVEVLEAIAP